MKASNSIIHRLFVAAVMMLTAVVATAGCYDVSRSKGIQNYNSGQYAKAKKLFSAAKACPDKPANNDLASWIKKCDEKLTPSGGGGATSKDTYINVENASETTVRFALSSANTSIAVSTNAPSWSVAEKPYWVNIVSRSKTKLEISVEAAGSARSGSLVLRTPKGHTATIHIYQEGSAGSGSGSGSGSNSNVDAGNAVINKVWVDHNQYNDGEKGMIIHTDLTVNNMKGQDISYAVFFYLDDDITQLKNSDDDWVWYKKEATVLYESSHWSDFQIFVPYKDLVGASNYTGRFAFDVTIFDGSSNILIENTNNVFSRSSFSYSESRSSSNNGSPTAKVNKMWVDHNQYVDGQKCMKIHIDLTVDNLKGKEVTYAVFFYLGDNTTQLKDHSGNWVWFSRNTTVQYDSSHWSDWWIAVPNSDVLNAANAGDDFTFDVTIFDDQSNIIGEYNNNSFSRSK